MSQAALVIMAAQKREELQREGDELDQEIRRREKEMRALEHTLEHLNVRNTQFRLSFHKADMSGHEADELKQLQDQAKMGSDALFRKKKELQRLQTDYEEDMRRLEQVNQQASRLVQRAKPSAQKELAAAAHQRAPTRTNAHQRPSSFVLALPPLLTHKPNSLLRLDEQNAHLVNAQVQVEKELEAQADALQKAEERLEKLKARHREQFEDPDLPGDETLYEKLFKAEAYEQNTGAVLQTLGQLSNEFPEIYDTLMTALGKNSLQIPTGRVGGEQ
jgi:hypothetical protein